MEISEGQYERILQQTQGKKQSADELLEISLSSGIAFETVKGIYAVNARELEKMEYSSMRSAVDKFLKSTFSAGRAPPTESKSSSLLDVCARGDFDPRKAAKHAVESFFKNLLPRGSTTHEGLKRLSSKWISDGSCTQLPASDSTSAPSIPEAHVARLRAEVTACVAAARVRPGGVDQLRENIGVEYEAVLQQHLLALGARFLSEDAERALRFSKTPDALLETPLLVGGVEVHWIDSKAYFGDADTLGPFLGEHGAAYTRRFGGGLVICWLGFDADAAAVLRVEFPDVVVRASFPEDAVLLA
jgi:hypothetical protein